MPAGYTVVKAIEMEEGIEERVEIIYERENSTLINSNLKKGENESQHKE